MLLLVKLYCVGERMRDSCFCNKVVDAFCTTMMVYDVNGKRWVPSPGLIDIVYAETLARSPARRLMVDCIMYYFDVKAPRARFTNMVLLNDLTDPLLKDRCKMTKVVRRDLNGQDYHVKVRHDSVVAI
jgi:hypothetical protein